MPKMRITWLSFGLALFVILIGLSVSDKNPLSLVQLPGWALAFGTLFTAEDSLLTKMKFQIIYWMVNLGVWFIVFYSILYTLVSLRKHFAN
jgi:hypothetical protein